MDKNKFVKRFNMFVYDFSDVINANFEIRVNEEELRYINVSMENFYKVQEFFRRETGKVKEIDAS